MPGKSSKDKGKRGEEKTAKFLTDCGIPSCRVFGSGAFPGMPGDVRSLMTAIGLHRNYQVEVKSNKKHVSKKTADNLQGKNDLFFSWADYDTDPIISMRGSVFAELIELIIKPEGE